MTIQDKIKLIREKCIAANPQKKWRDDERCHRHLVQDESVHDCYCVNEPVRLADVLLSIAERIGFATVKELGINSFGEFFFSDNIKERWNLRADDLEKQSEETINFLYELLK